MQREYNADEPLGNENFVNESVGSTGDPGDESLAMDDAESQAYGSETTIEVSSIAAPPMETPLD